MTGRMLAVFGTPALVLVYSLLLWIGGRYCSWCGRRWAWRRRRNGVRHFPICRRCAKASPREPLGTVEPTGSNFAKKPHG